MNWLDARAFIADFVHFAPRRIVLACALVAVSGLIEGFGIVLIIPILRVVGGATVSGGGSEQVLAAFTMVGANTRLSRIAVVLVALALAMVLRAVLLAQRQRCGCYFC